MVSSLAHPFQMGRKRSHTPRGRGRDEREGMRHTYSENEVFCAFGRVIGVGFCFDRRRPDMMRGSRAPSRFGVGLRARENTPRSNRAEPLCPLQI